MILDSNVLHFIAMLQYIFFRVGTYINKRLPAMLRVRIYQTPYISIIKTVLISIIIYGGWFEMAYKSDRYTYKLYTFTGPLAGNAERG